MDLTFEVLKTGTFNDSNGNPVTFTEDKLQEIADKYQPDNHEAPLVIGHPDQVPRTGDPAFGWVQKLERKGASLFASAKQVSKNLIDMIKQGSYKKVSVALNNDNTLHHIGFLGAVPPAVAGLNPITFSESELNLGTIIAETINMEKTDEVQNESNTPAEDGSNTENESGSEKKESDIEKPETENTVSPDRQEITELQDKIAALLNEIEDLKKAALPPDGSTLEKEQKAFSDFITEAKNKGNITPAQAETFLKLTEDFKSADLRQFAEQPGKFFEVVRKIVEQNTVRLNQPANYKQVSVNNKSSIETARAVIARQMNQ